MSFKSKILFFFLFCFLAIKSQVTFTEEKLIAKLPKLSSDTARARMLINFCKVNTSIPEVNLKYALKALQIAEEAKADELTVSALEVLGDVYWYSNNFAKAGEYYFKVLELADLRGLTRYKGRAFYNIGWMKCLQGESFKDRVYFIRALKIFEQIKDTVSIEEVYNALASVYNSNSDLNSSYVDSAGFYFKNLIQLSERSKDYYNVSVHANYASFLSEHGNNIDAKEIFLKCIEVATERKDTITIVSNRKSLAEIYAKTDSVEKAKKIFNEIIPILRRYRKMDALSNIFFSLSNVFKKEKQFELALESYRAYIKIRDSITYKINEAHLNEKEGQYEIAKKEIDIRKLEHINEVSELKNQQNKYVILGLLVIALLIALVSYNLFKSNKTKQKANQLLNEKNKLIEEQKKAVEEKNTDITNSINYAKRIQDALLPPKELKFKMFKDAFVLFMPKDIVSGDFYWFAEKEGKKLITAVDCTGHGVPGAFMSMIGNAFITEAVNEKGITNPALVLNELSANIVSSLKQSEVANSTKDGMDMALLSFNESCSQVEFAGANNPLWLIRNGELIEYKGDKRPIGYFDGKTNAFNSTILSLNKGDTLYIFTDGYADQFGGLKGKKFKYQQLKDLLLSTQNMPMLEQEQLLISKFSEWKGDLEQVDDVCVIGIRV